MSVATVESLIRASSSSRLQPLHLPAALGVRSLRSRVESRNRRISAGQTTVAACPARCSRRRRSVPPLDEAASDQRERLHRWAKKA
jgi:hypothetical protein